VSVEDAHGTCRLRVRVHADRQTVFRLLAEIELWPAIIPQIRSARVVRRSGTSCLSHRLVAFRAAWHGVSIGWRMIETVDPAAGTVTLRHLSPLTRGSVAVWTVGEPIVGADGSTSVDLSMTQDVRGNVPIIGDLLARGFGQKILLRIKVIAEGGSLAGRD
jgi:hypothetical protein